jgi:hypothetical protein
LTTEPTVTWDFRVTPATPVPHSMDGAADLMRHHKDMIERIERVNVMCSRAMDQLETRWAELVEPLKAENERTLALLEVWHRRHVADGGKAKIDFPYGTIKLNPQGQGQGEITDPEALLAWVETNAPGAVKPPSLPSVNMVELRKVGKPPGKLEPGSVSPLFDADGEMIPGVVVKIPARTWKVS